VFEHLEVVAPTAKGQVAGTDEDVAVAVAAEHGNLRMKYAHPAGDGDRFKLVFFTDPAGAQLAQARADALDIGQDQPLLSASANESIKDDGFEE
jgi:hypothetical protein